MKIRKSFFTAVVFALFTTASFAHIPSELEKTDSNTAIAEVQALVKKIKFNLEDLDQHTIKVHFMVNTANEVVVLRTSDEDVDFLIKASLNYKELKNKDLEANKVYILPISFQR